MYKRAASHVADVHSAWRLSRIVTSKSCYTLLQPTSPRGEVSVRFRMRLALGTVLLWCIGTGHATRNEAEIAPLGSASKIEF